MREQDPSPAPRMLVSKGHQMVLIYSAAVGSSGRREVQRAEWTGRDGFERCLAGVVREDALGR